MQEKSQRECSKYIMQEPQGSDSVRAASARGDSCAVKSVLSRRCPSHTGLAARSGGKSGATDPEINLNSREAAENPSASLPGGRRTSVAEHAVTRDAMHGSWSRGDRRFAVAKRSPPGDRGECGSDVEEWSAASAR